MQSGPALSTHPLGTAVGGTASNCEPAAFFGNLFVFCDATLQHTFVLDLCRLKLLRISLASQQSVGLTRDRAKVRNGRWKGIWRVKPGRRVSRGSEKQVVEGCDGKR